MKWFATYWLTVVVSAVAFGLYTLVPLVVPGSSILLNGKSINLIALITAGVYFLVWSILYRAIAYTESATEASPREDHTGTGFGESAAALMQRLFSNPVRWWMTPYALLLALAAIISICVRWFNWIVPGDPFGDWGAWQNLVFCLMLLYCLTVVLAMLNPDRPIPLRAAPEVELDPILEIAGDKEPVIEETKSQIDTAIGATLPAPPVVPQGITAPSKPAPQPAAPAIRTKPARTPKPPKPKPEVRYREHFWQFWRLKPPTIAAAPPLLITSAAPTAPSGPTAPAGPSTSTAATGATVASAPSGPSGPGSSTGTTATTNATGPTSGDPII